MWAERRGGSAAPSRRGWRPDRTPGAPKHDLLEPRLPLYVLVTYRGVSIQVSAVSRPRPAGLARVTQLAADTPSTVSGLPAVVNLLLYQGDDFLLDLTITNPDGSAFDLTGFTPTAQIKPQPGATLMATFTAGVDDTIPNVIHLRLPHLEAENLVPGPAMWDCQIAGDKVITLCHGVVTISPEVTT